MDKKKCKIRQHVKDGEHEHVKCNICKKFNVDENESLVKYGKRSDETYAQMKMQVEAFRFVRRRYKRKMQLQLENAGGW